MLDSLVNTHHLQPYSPSSLHYWSSWIMSGGMKLMSGGMKLMSGGMKLMSGGMKLLFQNNLYVKQKVLSSGAVCWECDQRRNKFAWKAKLHVLDNQVIKQVNDHTSTTLRIHTFEDFALVDIAAHRYLIWLFGTCTIKRLEIFKDSKQM